MVDKKHIGLFFGSFNPVHIGHIQIAMRFYETQLFDAIHLIISPANPHKDIASLAQEIHRYKMVELALNDCPYPIVASDIEFFMPKPSYTYDTLIELQKKYPNYNYSILLGSDNLDRLMEWKNIDYILEHHNIYCYDRGNDISVKHNHIHLLKMPILQISSTEIRHRIHNNLPIQSFVHDDVIKYIYKEALYK